MPSSRKRTRNQHTPNPSLLPDLLLSLRLPRCCVCDLDWFEDDDNDNDDEGPIEDKMSEEYLLVKCKKLIPLPRCKCSTTFFQGTISMSTPLNVNNVQNYMNGDDNDDDDAHNHISSKELQHIIHLAQANNPNKKETDLDQIATLLVNKFCHAENLKEYHKKAMCQDCIKPFVSTSNHVIEHDYKSDTQPNVHFSVGGKCTCCRTKFSARSLSALVLGAGSKSKSSSTSTSTSRNQNAELEMAQWVEHVKSTVQFVRFTKMLKSILRSKKRSASASEHHQNEDTVKNREVMDRWLDDTEEYQSDAYFSDFCMEESSIYTGSIHDEARARGAKSHSNKRPRIVSPAEGEIMQDLMNKDPKFRQELEDQEFIKRMSKTEEGRRMLGIEGEEGLELELGAAAAARRVVQRQSKEELEQDERLAREIRNREKSIQSMRIRGKLKPKPKPKAPILEYFSKVVKEAVKPKWSAARKVFQKEQRSKLKSCLTSVSKSQSQSQSQSQLNANNDGRIQRFLVFQKQIKHSLSSDHVHKENNGRVHLPLHGDEAKRDAYDEVDVLESVSTESNQVNISAGAWCSLTTTTPASNVNVTGDASSSVARTRDDDIPEPEKGSITNHQGHENAGGENNRVVSATIEILDSDDPDCRPDEDGDEDDMNFITGRSPHSNASSSCRHHSMILNSSKHSSSESQSQGLNTNMATGISARQRSLNGARVSAFASASEFASFKQSSDIEYGDCGAETEIQQLVMMGFDRNECKLVMDKVGNDPMRAINMLLDKK